MSAVDTAVRAHVDDPNRVGHHDAEASGHGAGGPASKRVIVAYGFWLFILSDIVMFSAVFATYAVLANATAGGPGPRQLFDLTRVGAETAFLLASSFVCGLASIAASVRNLLWTQVALLVTGLLGFAFIVLEGTEFARMIAEGAGPSRSAFLSAFFALVGLHGLHVSVGLLWLGTMMAQILAKGFRANIMRRLFCYTLFWHALDIVWVGVFTIVYLMGVE
jgi:heme/copper-type cytochrome/quinol oxidase subunit 3